MYIFKVNYISTKRYKYSKVIYILIGYNLEYILTLILIGPKKKNESLDILNDLDAV
jgi:hypothetical protein